jgi:hypothetical protein
LEKFNNIVWMDSKKRKIEDCIDESKIEDTGDESKSDDTGDESKSDHSVIHKSKSNESTIDDFFTKSRVDKRTWEKELLKYAKEDYVCIFEILEESYASRVYFTKASGVNDELLTRAAGDNKYLFDNWDEIMGHLDILRASANSDPFHVVKSFRIPLYI